MFIDQCLCHKAGIVIDIGLTIAGGRHTTNITWQPLPKEMCGTHFIKDKHIITEIDKLFRKSLYPMEIELYRIAAESGHILRRYNIPIVQDNQLGVLCIHPPRGMGICDEEHLIDPWCILLNAPE